MKKLLLLAFILLLAACSNTDDTTKPVANDTTGNSQPGDITLTESEAITIAENIIEELNNATYPTEVGEYNLAIEGEAYTEETWEKIHTLQHDMLKQFATESFIESNNLLNNAECESEECFTELPLILHFSWKPTVNILSDNEFQSISLIPPFSFTKEDYDSYEQIVHFVLENEEWKVNKLELVKKDINLSIEDLEEFVNNQAFINITLENTTIDYEFLDKTEKVYTFIDNDMNARYGLIARTGYIVFLEGFDDTELSEGEGDYSISTQEDYVSYHLFYDWTAQIEASSLNNLTNFYNEANEINQQRQAAYGVANEQQLEALLEDVYTLNEAIYAHLYETWDAELQQNNDLANFAWSQDVMFYFDDILPEDTSNLDRLNDEVIIYLNNIYSYISTTENP